MDAAERRHREERKKAKARRYAIAWSATPERIGKLARTPKPCSCWMCGNPRKWMKGKDRLTLQERRALTEKGLFRQ